MADERINTDAKLVSMVINGGYEAFVGQGVKLHHIPRSASLPQGYH